MEMNEISWLWGRFTFQSLPILHAIENPTVSEIIGATAGAVAVLGAVAVVIILTITKSWTPLWTKWLTSTDHKRIGIMYITLAVIMLLRGVIEGALMRTQQAFGLDGGFLSADHFGQLFSTHGTIMVFFVAMPFVVGFMNIIMPLQIGARDVSFPFLNQVSLALTASGAALIMISLVIGEFSTGGWTAYPPYTGKAFSPGVGPDYWIWAILIAGIGSTMTGINFVVTIFKERAPGMSLLRMPLFTWTALCTAIILIFAMPPLTVAALMMALDRLMDFHFFTNDLGGNLMNYANLFWLFGHPEVYLLVLPAYGIFSEVFATFCGKRLYGYKSLVYATIAISVMSFTVWLHHFFTMGQGANVNAAFGIATMVIAVPTGVKIYDWMGTMFRGRIRLSAPIIYGVGFLILFVIGGLTGVILANPTIDYQVHNSVFLVAHFHNVLIPGVLFGMLAGYHYWFPKVFGFRLNEKLGITAALLWNVGFSFTFLPLYFLGLMGMPRRSFSYSDPAFVPYTLVAVFGAMIILSAVTCLAIQLYVSIKHRRELAVPFGDPWNGRTLEWSIPSPPPVYNFAVLPKVTGLDSFTEAKENGVAYPEHHHFEDIELPGNTSIGFCICAASIFFGMAIIWYVWWLAVASLLFIMFAVIVRSFILDTDYVIPANQVRDEYYTWINAIKKETAITRDQEMTYLNTGVSALEPELRNSIKGGSA